MVDDSDDRPEFGPSGYLPERAAKRARKIVLRAPLGLQWIVASVVAGVVVVVAGVLFLTRSTEPPGEPWVAVAELSEIAGEVAPLESVAGEAAELAGSRAVVVGVVGRVRVFADAAHLELAYCPDSRRLEGAGGRVWSITGRGLNGEESLAEHPILVREGIVYVDPTRTTPGPAPSQEAAEPACR